MKPTLMVILVVVVAALVAACSGAPAVPTVPPPVVQEPTEVPTQAPTAVSVKEVPTQAPTAVLAKEAPTQAPAKAPTQAAAPAAAAGRFGKAWTPVKCDTFNVSPEVAAVADCGYVTVPENRTSGSDRQIKLAVVRVKSTAKTPGAPLVLGTGGPGGSGLQDVQGAAGAKFLTDKAPILKDRDFVLFSQRGTALAEPVLDCPAFSQYTVEASIKGLTPEERGKAASAALLGCAAKYKADGIDLAAYNSNENADDVDAIRQTLGYDKIFFYGESYGTQLGQFVLRRHPDILAGIMLDGIVPVTKEQTPLVTDIPGAFQNVFKACAADKACNANYPDLEKMLAETMDRLAKNPVPYTVNPAGGKPIDLKVDDVLAMNALFTLLYLPGGYATLPEAVKELHAGNLAPLYQTLPLVLQISSSARGMHFAINCTDDPATSLKGLGFENMPEVYRRFAESDAEELVSICPALNLKQLPADSDAPVKSDLPALLIQGGFDPATPRSGGLTVVKGLPKSTEVLVPGGSHVQFSNPCVVDIMAKFMADPAARPDLSCIDQTVAFGHPVTVSFAGPGAGKAISITLPPIFMALAPGQWADGEVLIVASSFPPTQTVESVLKEAAALLKIQDLKTADGPTIAGMKSTFAQTPAYQLYAFGDKDGTYRLLFQALNPNTVDFQRKNVYPDLLKSVTVGPAAPAAPAKPEVKASMAVSNTARLRRLDFAPFEKALAGFTPERAAQVDALVKDATIPQVQAAMQAGKLTSEELTLYFLARIKKYDEALRTYIELNPDALNEAQAADQARKQGKAAPMLGIPVSLKDNIETAAPLHTSGGAQILLNNQPKADAPLVKQLRDAGAVILGKANLSELAGGIAIQPPGSSAVGGLTGNPHGPYSAGGSSSGSAAGTAAYLAMASVGSETAGSLIAPASWNGVVGMYPSKGVVSGSGVIPLIKNNDSAGPIGRSVTDVATLLEVIDSTSADYAAGLNPKALGGVKAGFLKADVLAHADSELEDTSDNAAVAALIEKSLAAAGATPVAIEFKPAEIGGQFDKQLLPLIAGGVRHDMLPYLTAAAAPVKTAEDLAAYNLKDPKTRIPFGQIMLDITLQITPMQDVKVYAAGIAELKDAATKALDAAFADNKVDVLVSVNNYHSSIYATANYPAISVPLGLRKNGMPVGVTLIGKPGQETKLLAYAYALEQASKLRVDPDLS